MFRHPSLPDASGVRWGQGQPGAGRSARLAVWVLPSDLGGGADEQQDSGHDAGFSRFQSIFGVI